jgi:hypothetical protein
MSSEFAIAEVLTGRLNTLVKNIMFQTGATDPNEAVRLVNSGEWVVSKPVVKWREQGGVIYFTLPPTEGVTGHQWIERFEKKNFRFSRWARNVLDSPDFKPTTGIVYNIAVLKGELFSDENRITRNIRAEGDHRSLKHGKGISPEIACLIRETFTDDEIKAMGMIWIIVMHEPIDDGGDDPYLLSADRYDAGRWLDAYYVGPGRRWGRGDGFAFVVPQVSP